MELNQNKIRQLKGLIVFTIIVGLAGVNYQKIIMLARWLFGLVTPFLVGLAIAFILNLPMKKIEKHLPVRLGKWRRSVSLILTLVFVITVLLLAVFVVVPEVFRTLWGLQESIPAFGNRLQAQVEGVFSRYPKIIYYIDQIEIDWLKIAEQLASFLKDSAGVLLISTMSAAVTLIDVFVMFGIAFMFSLYILMQKETLGRQLKHLMAAFLPVRVTERILQITALADEIFSSFLAGQCLEAVILGTMFFIVLLLLKLPYALLIGVLIAFTALVPVFGSFVGCAVGTVLMLISNPLHALTFLIIFFLLQQIEGNLIYPHVVGNSVGLPAIWVLVAVTVGGNMMGVVGMLIFIPLCSVFYTLLREEMYRRDRQRRPGRQSQR